MFVEALNALNIAMGDALKDVTLPVGNNHIFLNLLPPVEVNPDYVEHVIKNLGKRYAERLRRLRVSQVEFRLIAIVKEQRLPVRLVATNPTGYVLRVDSYVEHRDASNSVPKFISIAVPARSGFGALGSNRESRTGEWDGKSVLTPYPVTTLFEQKRALAATLSDTIYA
jgi:acetyl-CoA carboxylase / biotin carboxylase 1